MDYLVNEGYPSAAQKFALEAKLKPPAHSEVATQRVNVKNAIVAGDIQNAIEQINDLNPQILDMNPSLHFALLQLQLIEIIKRCTASSGDCDIRPALEFARQNLAPRAPTRPEFLQDLEKTMALLIFPADKLRPDLEELLDPRLRLAIASRVNAEILTSQGDSRESKIKGIVHLRAWAEQQARKAKIEIPSSLPLGLEPEKGDGSQLDAVMKGDDSSVHL